MLFHCGAHNMLCSKIISCQNYWFCNVCWILGFYTHAAKWAGFCIHVGCMLIFAMRGCYQKLFACQAFALHTVCTPISFMCTHNRCDKAAWGTMNNFQFMGAFGGQRVQKIWMITITRKDSHRQATECSPGLPAQAKMSALTWQV